MRKGIDHRLNAEVLKVLRAMGHGDVVVPVARFAFHDRARDASAVIQTGARHVHAASLCARA